MNVPQDVPREARIFVAGHRGLAGSALVRALERQGFSDIVTRGREQLDLRNAGAVAAFFAVERPAYVFLAAAKVGGIFANSSYPADFILENLQIQTNVISAALTSDVKKLVFLGSSCIYPKMAPQPMREEALLAGPLEPTNEAYAVAKIAGLSLCKAIVQQYKRAFIALMPTNLYGPNDNYHPENSHVLPGMLRRFHEAKICGAPTVAMWGSGTPIREFLHVDDFAEAALLALGSYTAAEHLNVGSGVETSIRDAAEMVREIVGYEGEIVWDTNKPDGTPRKALDSTRLRALGWRPAHTLRNGLIDTYNDFLANHCACATVQREGAKFYG